MGIKGQLVETEWFLLQNLLSAQHVSGTVMPIIRSAEVIQMVAACGTWHFGLQVVVLVCCCRLCVRVAGCCCIHYAHYRELKSYTDGCCLWYMALWFTGCWSDVEL